MIGFTPREHRAGRPAATLAAVVLAAGIAGPALAQGAPQSLSLPNVDQGRLDTGYRASQLIGSQVVNDKGETVGTVADLIVTPSDKVPFAVLSVGGFLGIDTHYVVVPCSALDVLNKQTVLVGGTREALKALPTFHYAG